MSFRLGHRGEESDKRVSLINCTGPSEALHGEVV